MKNYDVTLVFTGGVYGTFNGRIPAKNKADAKAKSTLIAKQCGFLGAVKKAEIIELSA
jgi:hypothetical protein